jgi:hypothetical protein
MEEKPTFRQVDLEPVNTTASLAGKPVNFPHFARVGPLSDIRFHSPNFAETIRVVKKSINAIEVDRLHPR